MSVESYKAKMSFKEYYDSTRKLKEASDALKYYKTYEVNKYCKLPLMLPEEEEKLHISLKPNDRIRVLWESNGPNNKIPKLVMLETDIEDVKYNFVWNPTKVADWLESSTYR